MYSQGGDEAEERRCGDGNLRARESQHRPRCQFEALNGREYIVPTDRSIGRAASGLVTTPGLCHIYSQIDFACRFIRNLAIEYSEFRAKDKDRERDNKRLKTETRSGSGKEINARQISPIHESGRADIIYPIALIREGFLFSHPLLPRSHVRQDAIAMQKKIVGPRTRHPLLPHPSIIHDESRSSFFPPKKIPVARTRVAPSPPTPKLRFRRKITPFLLGSSDGLTTAYVWVT